MKNFNINPKKQINLYGYDNIFLKIVDLYNKNKLPNKILFYGNSGIGKATLSYHLINYILSKNEKHHYDLKNFKINNLNKSYKLVSNYSHPNFFLIDLLEDKKFIEISQIREMINYTNKSSFNNNKKIVLIDNVEKLNLNSINALLKIVEEPNDNTFFILVFDNNQITLDTLKSRCIKYNLSLSHNVSISITNKLIGSDVKILLNKDFINYYNTPGDFLKLIKFSNENHINIFDQNIKNFIIKLIETNSYKKNIFIKENIYKFIEYYFLNKVKLDEYKINFISKYSNFIKNISNIKKYNLDEESLFIELKSKLLNG